MAATTTHARAARSLCVSVVLLMDFIPVATRIARLQEETDRFTEQDFGHDIDGGSTVVDATALTHPFTAPVPWFDGRRNHYSLL